jgi:YggT family protein
VIPPLGGIDLSVLVALILLQIAQYVLGRLFF